MSEDQPICRQVEPEPTADDLPASEPVPVLDRAGILAASDNVIEAVHVSEWGGVVHIRTISGADREAYENAVTLAQKGGRLDARGLRGKLLVRCICDEAGELLFTENDIAALAKKSARAIECLFDAAQHLNGLTEEDVEGLAGN